MLFPRLVLKTCSCVSTDEKSSVIPETESKREVVDVPDLKEATKEETLNNDAEENKEENKAASNGKPFHPWISSWEYISFDI